MAVSLLKMSEELEAASLRMEGALAELGSMDRMTNIESYILGNVRCAQAGIRSAIDFVQQCKAYKEAGTTDKAASKRQPSPRILPPTTEPG
jgi:hypothetical protein